MGYHARIESKTLSSFLTTRSRNSELWFVNNPNLEKAILGYAAKYAKRYQVTLYALSIEGNHIHGTALFPQANRSDFMRDLNSSVARAIPRYTPTYNGGRFWARRYSAEFLPGADDIEEYFFYTVLQPINDGLVEKLSQYPGYNCFHDAIWGIKRKFKTVRWKEYYLTKRFNSKISIKDFTDIVTLEYARLPGYEELSQKEYVKIMKEKCEERIRMIVEARRQRGASFLGRAALIKVKPGSMPHSSKVSSISSHRPRVLSVCHERRAQYRKWYFEIYFAYKEASSAYRQGKLDTEFPEGTYRPHLKCREKIE